MTSEVVASALSGLTLSLASQLLQEIALRLNDAVTVGAGLPAIECAALALQRKNRALRTIFLRRLASPNHRIERSQTCNYPNAQPYRVNRQRRIEWMESHSSKITHSL